MTVQSKLPLTAAETALVDQFGEQFGYRCPAMPRW
jgi:hypothetical protein